MKRRAIFWALLLLPWSRLGLSAELTAKVTADFSDSSVDQIAEGAKILQRRFSEFVSSKAASVKVTVDKSKVVVTLSRVALSDSSAKALASLQGAFQLLVDGRVVATDADIEKANVTGASSAPFMNLVLSEVAGKRLSAATRTAVGRPMSIVWEGRVVLTAPVRGEVGREVVFNAPSRDEALLMLVVLRVGRLSKAPVTVDLRVGT